MPRQHRTKICREGWYYLLVLAVVIGWAILREVNLLYMVAGLFVGPLLLSWRLTRATLRNVQLRRRVPQGVCAGDTLVVNVELTNARKRLGSWTVTVEDEVRREEASDDEEPIRPKVFFPYVPAGRARGQAYWGRLPRRGRYRLGPLKASTRFPFGLVRRTIRLDATDTLIVYPRLGRLRPGWLVEDRRRARGTQVRQGQPCRVSDDLYGVREWRPGDSLRWIHWRSSVRRGKVVVRQFEEHRNRDVAVVADLWQPEAPEPVHLENVELAVSLAATVVAHVCRQGGCFLTLGVTGVSPQSTGGPTSTPLLEDAMRRLAVAEASNEDHLPKVFGQVLEQVHPGTEVVLISTRDVDPHHRERLAAGRRDPSGRSAAGRILPISTATDRLADYFELE
ncbi:MAG: DUF58 domain-containing protein [Planctomycetota bacterium]